MVPCLRVPLTTVGTQRTVVVSVPQIVCVPVHAYVHGRNFAETQKDDNS